MNCYTFANIKHLVARNVFQHFGRFFLPMGHTHDDIDQVYQKSERLKSTDAVTFSVLYTDMTQK